MTFALALSASLVAFPAPAQSRDTGDDAATASGSAVMRPVKLITVEPEAQAFERHFFGHVVAPQTVDLSFKVGGRIAALPIVEGSEIAAGGLVAQLDLDPFERALERARVALDQARRNADRTARLKRSNSVSLAAAEDAQSALELAQIAYNDAREALEDATLYAPFDAVVSDRGISNYTTVAAGTPIARLLDLSEIWININVPEILFRLQSGAAPEDIEIFAEFPGTDRSYPLEFREYNAETSSVGQTYEVTLGMVPPDDQRILPGASAMVTVRIREGDHDLVLPASALFGDSKRQLSVMIFEADAEGSNTGTVRKQAIDATPLPSGTVFRIDDGLEAGTEVVAAGAALLADGQKVRRFQGLSE
ncbi:MAG: efflux transporter periplasmic adaptor subunit [Gammaproteobacteria bacterium]|nr:MAG: efflux transporter periplasmic adaptor subunit [Gammaproteobacteria bacterium]